MGQPIYISYVREDSNAALRLYEDLRKGLSPWLDRQNLLQGQTWDAEIRSAIKNSRYFIALFSSRGYVQKEFRKAIDVFDEFPEREVFVIPVRLDDCDIPVELSDFQYVDLFPDWDEGVKRLLEAFEVR